MPTAVKQARLLRFKQLRSELLDELLKKRAAIDAQIKEITGIVPRTNGHAKQASPTKGRKIKAKYLGPNGETWAGRGAQPRWLVRAINEGAQIESFLVAK